MDLFFYGQAIVRQRMVEAGQAAVRHRLALHFTRRRPADCRWAARPKCGPGREIPIVPLS